MGDEAFRELSRPDPTADQLLDDVSTDLVCFLRFFDAVPGVKKLSICSASWPPAAGVQTARLSFCCTGRWSGQNWTTAVVYGSSRKSYMAKLAPVQNQGLRICLNAFRTTNAASLHVEFRQ